MEKSQLINTLRIERAAWEALLKEIGEERMTVPGVVGDWSVKDIIAHITAWQRRPVEWLAAARRGDKPTPAPWPSTLAGDDPINAWIFEANRNRPLSEVLAESRDVHDQLMKGLESIPEQELNDASRYTWLNGNSLADSIPGNSLNHYPDHAQDIHAWLKLARA